MTQILQPYEVAVIHSDVETHESRLDILYSLEHLDSTINDIFGRVEKRITDERTRLDQINNRIATCHTKVNGIRGSKKATTIFSTAKFPAPRKLPGYPTLFSQMAALPSAHREAVDDVHYYPPDASKSIVGNDATTEENLLLLTRMNQHGSDMERVEFVMEDEGLGRVPENVDYVSSLLLFNSAVNPYKNYTAMDNLMSSGRGGKDDAAAFKGLASAPTSMLNGDVLPDIQGLDLTFKPEMGQMASLALPSNLPLDFLADINYEGAELPSIAPSAAKANYTLPAITDGGFKASPSMTEQVQSLPGAPPPAPAAASAAPPPPPPPPPANMPPPPVAAAGAPPPPVAAQPGPPPAAANVPPPPPPAAAAAAEESEEEEEAPGPAGGGGASFLDAIKGMSVNKLRKASEKDVKDEKAKKAAAAAAKPANMMDDLQSIMKRRNNALTGKDAKQAIRRESVAVAAAAAKSDAVSAPVPPPPGGASKQPGPPSGARPPPPSAPAKPKSALLSMGFANIDEDAGDSDNEPPMPAASRYRQDEDSSDDSSVSDVSDVSFEEQKRPVAAPVAAPVIALAPRPAPAPAPVEMPSPSQKAVPANRRGSLLDESNKGVAAMLAHGKEKEADSGSGSDDDDWD